jgi:hypothetical protein
VEIDKLDPDKSTKLATTYLSHFRGEFSPPDPLYPFTPDAIALVDHEADGNTRRILRMLYFAMEEGRKNGFSTLSSDFITEKHENIAGRVPAEV